MSWAGEVGRRLRGRLGSLACAPLVLAALALARRLPDAIVGPLALRTGSLIAEQSPERRRGALLPGYVALCGTRRWRKQAAGAGDAFGRAAVDLAGAFVDVGAPRPQLGRCAREATEPACPERGAGISAARWRRHANRIATPSHALFCDSAACGLASARGEALRRLWRRDLAT